MHIYLTIMAPPGPLQIIGKSSIHGVKLKLAYTEFSWSLHLQNTFLLRRGLPGSCYALMLTINN